MRFDHDSARAILEGRKTQARFLFSDKTMFHVKRGEITHVYWPGGRARFRRNAKHAVNLPHPTDKNLLGPSVGTIRLLRIRVRDIGEITDAEARAEGVVSTEVGGWRYDIGGRSFFGASPREAYLGGWFKLHPRSKRSDAVIVLEFASIEKTMEEP